MMKDAPTSPPAFGISDFLSCEFWDLERLVYA